jgi:hypothetical protein
MPAGAAALKREAAVPTVRCLCRYCSKPLRGVRAPLHAFCSAACGRAFRADRSAQDRGRLGVKFGSSDPGRLARLRALPVVRAPDLAPDIGALADALSDFDARVAASVAEDGDYPTEWLWYPREGCYMRLAGPDGPLEVMVPPGPGEAQEWH